MTTAVGGAKKKLNRADFMFNQVTGQTLVKKPGDIDGVQFAIRYLTDCHASVFDYTGQVSKLTTKRSNAAAKDLKLIKIRARVMLYKSEQSLSLLIL
jgi:hypothetical protein